MKKILIYILLIYVPILVNLFTNIGSMENMKHKIQGSDTSSFLLIPNEIKLYILELLIKNIIENDDVFDLNNNVKTAISNVTLVNKEFVNLRFSLTEIAREYIKKSLTPEYVNLSQKKKDMKLKNIFINIYKSDSELEIEAAKLITVGANPNLYINNNTELMIIIKTDKFKNLVKLLISHGVDINAQDNNGYTALIWAAKYGRKNIAQLLINADADINKSDENGNTALMKASVMEKKDIIELLISAGADINAKNNNGTTALIQASGNDVIDIVELLINAGADINIENNQGITALMWAVICDNINIVKLLIDSGVNINLKNKHGNTALTWAIRDDHKDIVKLLKAAGRYKGYSNP